MPADGPEDRTERVDEETLKAIRDGIAAEGDGRAWSLEQVIEFARSRREEWLKREKTQKSA
jgi:hypothetical protein